MAGATLSANTSAPAVWFVGYRAGLGELGVAERLAASLGGGESGNRALRRRVWVEKANENSAFTTAPRPRCRYNGRGETVTMRRFSVMVFVIVLAGCGGQPLTPEQAAALKEVGDGLKQAGDSMQQADNQIQAQADRIQRTAPLPPPSPMPIMDMGS
jgi:hypothetical protein